MPGARVLIVSTFRARMFAPFLVSGPQDPGVQFVDEAVIEVTGGHGGKGCISFRREAHVPFGGPDGGDGGRGGNIVAVASTGVATLLDHRYRRFYRAEHGDHGEGARKHGKDAPDVVIPVPVGTQIIDEATGAVLHDLDVPGKEAVLAHGGRGGRGNIHYTTPTRQAPRIAQPGEEGEHRVLRLNLKLVADVGLIGLPNAGKSTLLRALTNSHAKVGDYPFTTLVPNLGVYRHYERDIIIADIPGLIEGAHEGHGLGDRFLKHVERTRVLVHLISLSPDAMDPLTAYRVVLDELAAWSPVLAEYPQIVVLNKIDLIAERAELELWREEFLRLGVKEVCFASGLTREGVQAIMTRAASYLEDPAGDEETAETKRDAWSPV
jgi:GTP-binding protein